LTSPVTPRLVAPSRALWLAAASLLNAEVALAQTPPDAGSLLQQIEQQRRTPLPRRADLPPAPAPMQALKGPTVTVSSFRFQGNTLLSSAQLAPALATYLNRALTFAELQNAAAAVAAVYREAGWVVRVYLPQQDISSGEVTLQVIEAVFGAARVEGQPQRVAPARI
jgi:hemolysin activation/secretion protein